MNVSCGIALRNSEGKYLFVKGGGPFFKNKKRSYGIPKGGMEEGESFEDCARREFFEETGIKIDSELELVYDSEENNKNKRLIAFVANGEFSGEITSNLCKINYLGKEIMIPEVCDPLLLTLDDAEEICYKSQIELVNALREYEKKKTLR